MIFTRQFCMPKIETFQMLPVKYLLAQKIKGCSVIIDPFARTAKVGTITNDINPKMQTDYNLDALEFAKKLCQKEIIADLILFDPPYSMEQAKRSYELSETHFSKTAAQSIGRWAQLKTVLSKLLKPNGVVISFGYSSTGFGRKRGFVLEEVHLLNHAGGHYDTIICI